MYCLGFPKILNDSEPEKGKVICIRASRDRSFFAAVYQRAVSIWYYRPHVSLVSYVRGDESVEEFGCNQDVAWRPDGFMLAVVVRYAHRNIETTTLHSIVHSVYF
jgi:hypothetical protein